MGLAQSCEQLNAEAHQRLRRLVAEPPSSYVAVLGRNASAAYACGRRDCASALPAASEEAEVVSDGACEVSGAPVRAVDDTDASPPATKRQKVIPTGYLRSTWTLHTRGRAGGSDAALQRADASKALERSPAGALRALRSDTAPQPDEQQGIR